MIRRALVGVTVGILAALVAVPAEAAEWCVTDPALHFDAPHSKKITIYLTEGVMGAQHANALHSPEMKHEARPGDKAGTLSIWIHERIHSDRHKTFGTLVIASSEPYGGGVVYAWTTGSSESWMDLHFLLDYGSAGAN
jgi:hypothetical protein